MTGIEWTEAVLNPTTGCDRVSLGCDHCYALTMAKRLKGMGSAKYQTDGDPRTSGPGFGIAMHPDTLTLPLTWRKPRRVFVNSMSDLFHDGVSDEYIASVFVTMAATPQHTYQTLTKRHGRMRSLLSSPRFQVLAGAAAFDWIQEHERPVGWSWPLSNVHLGVSVENQQWADIRIPALLETPAAVRWLSCEPLLGPAKIGHWLTDPTFNPAYRVARCGQQSAHERHVMEHGPDQPRNCPGNGGTPHSGIDWVVVGGESGPGARPMELAWARSLVQQCRDARVPVFVKQLGSVWAKDTYLGGKPVSSFDPKGGDWNYWPADLMVREYPEQGVRGEVGA